MELSINAQKVLEKRYLLKDEEGKVVETPEEMFRRVAEYVAQADLIYDKNTDVENTTEEFYQTMSCLEFLPNSPTLMNAGTPLGQLSACFVLPVADSIPDIFDALKNMAIIHKSGGGVGFSFSNIRPQGDVVKSTKGIASGPVSFMKIFNVATDIIKQGGRRRGANMGILSVYHPDIIKFIKCKEKRGILNNFNLSVAVDHTFMEAVQSNDNISLINPRDEKIVQNMLASEIFDLMVEMAWKTGDPGIIFLDEINKANPIPHLGRIDATNPCGEQPLLNYESCNLGSINLVKMVKNRKINWSKLQKTIQTAVHFLDNVIDVNTFPLETIKNQTEASRKIGLGVMGFADMLLLLNISYDSLEALQVAEKIMEFISSQGRATSVMLGQKRGSFPTFKKSIWYRDGFESLRNATVTTIAPTGSVSIIANATSGIEPLFAVSYIREMMDGTRLLEVNDIFRKKAKEDGFDRDDVLKEIARKGSLQHMPEIPAEIKRIFVTAHDIDPGGHVKMQAAFQKYVDNGVSKTVNLSHDASKEDVKKAFLLAYQLHCKGITIYRDGSKEKQVLYRRDFSNLEEESQEDNELERKYLNASSEYSGGCSHITCPH